MQEIPLLLNEVYHVSFPRSAWERDVTGCIILNRAGG